MKLKLSNANIIYFENELPKIMFGNIYIDGEYIVDVGSNKDFIFDKEIDLNGKIAIPGFVNSYIKLCQNFSHKNISCEYEYAENLNLLNFQKEDYYWQTMLSICQCLKNGITTVIDASEYSDESIQAVQKTGFNAYICIGFYKNSNLKIKDLEKNIQKYRKQNINIILYTENILDCDEKQYSEIICLAKKYQLSIITNASKNIDEVTACLEKNKMSPIQLLENYGFFDTNSCVVGANELDENDINTLAYYGTSVVTTPQSDCINGRGIANINALNNRGVNILIGSNNPTITKNVSIINELSLLSLLQKTELKDNKSFSPNDILKFSSLNAQKLIKNNKMGNIKAGFYADIAVIDNNSLSLSLSQNILNDLIYCQNSSNIFMTIVKGKVLYLDNSFYINEKFETILENVKKINERIKYEE